MLISQKTFDFIVAQEVTGKDYYTKHYQRPEWPGVSSGVTIAIGYDLGQASAAKIKADWADHVPADMLGVMMGCAGITGAPAKSKCASVRAQISIPWEAAMDVFANRDVPAWTATVIKAVPGANKLNGDLLGVLVDTAYNRGAGGFNSTSPRNIEMRNIRDDVKDGKDRLALVPREFRSMKRLWPGVSGLQRRCEGRAKLWEDGLSAKSTPSAAVAPTPTKIDPKIPLKEGPARTQPPATTNAQNGTSAVILGGGAIAAQQAHAHGLIASPGIIFIGFIAVLAAATIWIMWYRNRNPK